jgi:hypothetical protein
MLTIASSARRHFARPTSEGVAAPAGEGEPVRGDVRRPHPCESAFGARGRSWSAGRLGILSGLVLARRVLRRGGLGFGVVGGLFLGEPASLVSVSLGRVFRRVRGLPRPFHLLGHVWSPAAVMPEGCVALPWSLIGSSA